MFDAVGHVEEAVAKLLASEQPIDVQRLRRLVDRLEFVWLQSVRDAERRGEWQADGFASTASWLRSKCRLTHGAAASAVRLARTLEELPLTAQAFSDGDISRQHAEVLARAATPERRDALVELEQPLVDVAKLGTPQELRGIVQQVTDALDGDGGAAADAARREQRRLHVSKTLHGMVAIDGLLDPESGEIVMSALEAAMNATHAADDSRTQPQRRADALVEVCQVGAAHHAEGPGRRNLPNMSTVLDMEVLEDRGGVEVARLVRAEAAHVGRLSPATLQRIACDCRISRVITDGRSQPLDVGRTTRVIPAALWRALVVRDGGCVAPGCDRPPGWCEVHHTDPWYLGGKTSLETCELRCHRHHIGEHEREAGFRRRAP